MDRIRITLSEELLTSKEVCYILKWSRWTLWRRKLEGCPFVGGRIAGSRLAWWLEQRDVAQGVGMTVRSFLGLSRRRREVLLARVRRERSAELKDAATTCTQMLRNRNRER